MGTCGNLQVPTSSLSSYQFPSLTMILEIITFGLALWLGLYLIARDLAKPLLRWAGLGLVAYALSLATDLLQTYAPTPALALLLARLHWPLLFLPALFWLGAIIQLLPEEHVLRTRLDQGWRYGLLPGVGLLYTLSAGANLIFDFTTNPPEPGPAYWLFAAAILLPMLLALLLISHTFRALSLLQAAFQPPIFRGVQQRSLGLLLAATLFFTLGAGLLIFPLNWLPRAWVLLSIGLDLICLGLAIAMLDAFAEGETLRLDFFRSFDYAFLTTLLFGGLVGLTMGLGAGVTFPMIALLLATITTALSLQVFAGPLQTALDKLSLAGFPHLQQVRADLRAAADALPRAGPAIDLAALDEAEFTHLTRRALSHMGDLARLATSPLIYLPLIETRLAERGVQTNTLERAVELKILLTESVARLKPRQPGGFGISEEWRYYNALYFPYVAGLKPYSQRLEADGLDPSSQEALIWFRTYVPERTLHNWQNVAAKLVAQDLREQMVKA